MKVLIGTPCGGGMVTNQYLMSILQSYNDNNLHKQNIAQQIMAQIPGFDKNKPEHQQIMAQSLNQHTFDFSLYTLNGESLLQRGRNHIAQVCLTQGFDKLLFIDADAGWTFEQMAKILSSPHPLIAGLCPLKTYPISLNFLPFAEDEKYFNNAIRDFEGTAKMAEDYKSPVVKVPFVGTAFMCIHRSVFMKLSETVDHYLYPNPHTGQTESHWDFFKVESISDTYLSEDWGLCHKARQAGFDVHVDTSVIITHTGNHTFVARGA